MTFPPRRLYTIPLAGGGRLSLGERPLVMGILNVTPDSFAGGVPDAGAAVAAAAAMEAAGADLIDVGGESTRPGADAVAAEEACERSMARYLGMASVSAFRYFGTASVTITPSTTRTTARISR